MQISKLEIKNYRSIKYINIDFDSTTSIIGENNSGKSAILSAIAIFFEPKPKISLEDYYKYSDDPIEIIVEFFNFTEDEINEFGTAIYNNKMVVKRVFPKTTRDYQYEVLAKTFPEFDGVRSNSKSEGLKFYRSIKDKYSLPPVQSYDRALEEIIKWENNNKDKLENRYLRDFFGAPNIASGKLSKRTSVQLIKASHNIYDIDNDKNPIIQLLSTIAKQVIDNNNSVKEFISKAIKEYSELTDPERIPDLSDISRSLTEKIQSYYSDSKLKANWSSESGINFGYPRPSIEVENMGFTTKLDMVGHGLQRVALFSVISFLAEKRFSSDTGDSKIFSSPQSDIIILIEEPEIYQHPIKQYIIRKNLIEITEGFNQYTGIRVQIIYTTHSEKLISIRNFNLIRLIRRSYDGDDCKHFVYKLPIEKCINYFSDLLQKEPMPKDAFLAKMHVFSNDINEGFFTRKVILVEGEVDKAALEAYALSINLDLLSLGILIIPVGGKTLLDKPCYVFRSMGIDTYIIFDSDKKKYNSKKEEENNINTNKLLQKINNVSYDKLEDYPVGVFEGFAAFEDNLESYMKLELDDEYEKIREQVCKSWGLNQYFSDFKKTPALISGLMQISREKGISLKFFEEIFEKLIKKLDRGKIPGPH